MVCRRESKMHHAMVHVSAQGYMVLDQRREIREMRRWTRDREEVRNKQAAGRAGKRT